ncbi:Transposable element tcb2 transposase [Caligus rogercresseyi]|uniref:Transposable element tcb2 transposase n=1 Tax=Caligus rogercresseyi TaxID=217165 RepID=A0A7T8GTQ9_CALRO|nr:Transposable element tcb2 transposase [Caligus rogercresseyi]
MEEEKRHTMFASFRARRSPKEAIEFFNYPKSTVYDQWKARNSFKKNDTHRKKRFRSLGATRTDEFVAEVKRKVNEDGNKSYAKLAAEMGCPKQTIANTINKDLGYSSWICQNVGEVPVVKHTKFPSSVMVLGVISSEGDVMPPHFFEKGLKVNTVIYIDVMKNVVKPWMETQA